MLKSSIVPPALSAAVSHRGLSPLPAHVWLGLSGLRYFGATWLLRLDAPVLLAIFGLSSMRSSLASSDSSIRRCAAILSLSMASTWLRRAISLFTAIVLGFV